MNKQKILRIVTVITIIMSLMLLSVSCARDSGQQSHSVEFTDMKDRLITLDQPARKLVVLSAGECEILYAIGAGDYLIGRGEYCDYPEEVKALPAVQSGNETNTEQIIALQPDLVIMSTMAQTLDQVETLENAGLKVAVTHTLDLEGVYEAIEMIGLATGHKQEAADLTESMKSSFLELENRAKDSKKFQSDPPSVYFEVSPLEYGLWTAGKETFMDELAAIIQMENTFADVNGWGEISQEQVIERDPDFIASITMYFGEGPLPEDEIKARPGWHNIKAIKNDHVIHLNTDELSRPGPRLVDGLESLFDFVYE